MKYKTLVQTTVLVILFTATFTYAQIIPTIGPVRTLKTSTSTMGSVLPSIAPAPAPMPVQMGPSINLPTSQSVELQTTKTATTSSISSTGQNNNQVPVISKILYQLGGNKIVNSESFTVEGKNLTGNLTFEFYKKGNLVESNSTQTSGPGLNVTLWTNGLNLTPGDYDLVIINSYGKSKPFKVSIVDKSTLKTTSITVTNPKGGTKFSVGDNLNIAWNVTNPYHYVASIYLAPVDSSNNIENFGHEFVSEHCHLNASLDNTCLKLSTKKASFKVPNVASGSYKVLVRCRNANSESSGCGTPMATMTTSGTITVSNERRPATTTPPVISTTTPPTSPTSGIVSPTNNQYLEKGKSVDITWKSSTPASSGPRFYTIRLVPDASSKNRQSFIIKQNISSSNTSHKWTVSTRVPDGMYSMIVLETVRGRQTTQRQVGSVKVNIGKGGGGEVTGCQQGVVFDASTGLPCPASDAVVRFSSDNSSGSPSIYIYSSQNGSTELIQATFEINAHVSGGQASDLYITKDLAGVYFQGYIGSSTGPRIQAQSTSRSLIPNKPFY